VIKNANEKIDKLQTEALRLAKASSTQEKDTALLHKANEQWQRRCAQLKTTTEDLSTQLEEQAEADALSSMKQLEALAEQVSLLTKKLGAPQGEKEKAAPDTKPCSLPTTWGARDPRQKPQARFCARF
jgi:hypothetical protein